MGAALTKPFAEIKKAMMDALKDTTNAYVKFATIYVEAIDEDAKNADKIKQAFKPKIAPDKWAQIEAVGRKWMHPAIALGEAGVNAGAIRRLPYSLQERVMQGERFPMLTSGGELPLMVDIKEIEGKFPSIKIVEVKNLLEALTAVATGKADATQGNLAVLSYLIQRNHLANLKVAAPARTTGSKLSMGVRKDWSEFVPMLEKALDSISREERDRINNHWVRVEFQKEVDYRLVFSVLGIAPQ